MALAARWEGKKKYIHTGAVTPLQLGFDVALAARLGKEKTQTSNFQTFKSSYFLGWITKSLKTCQTFGSLTNLKILTNLDTSRLEL